MEVGTLLGWCLPPRALPEALVPPVFGPSGALSKCPKKAAVHSVAAGISNCSRGSHVSSEPDDSQQNQRQIAITASYVAVYPCDQKFSHLHHTSIAILFSATAMALVFALPMNATVRDVVAVELDGILRTSQI